MIKIQDLQIQGWFGHQIQHFIGLGCKWRGNLNTLLSVHIQLWKDTLLSWVWGCKNSEIQCVQIRNGNNVHTKGCNQKKSQVILSANLNPGYLGEMEGCGGSSGFGPESVLQTEESFTSKVGRDRNQRIKRIYTSNLISPLLLSLTHCSLTRHSLRGEQ